MSASPSQSRPTSTSTSTSAPTPSTALQSSLQTLIRNYTATTPARVKLIDAFLLFLLLSGIQQFVYRVVISSYPYNAFLGGCVPPALLLPTRSALMGALGLVGT